MGSAPWDCYTKYQPDLKAALQYARKTELESGQYACSCEKPEHTSFEEAMECADADGTCSVIDIEDVSTETLKGEMDEDPGTAYALSPENIVEFFGSDKPTKEMVESADGDWYDMLGRGCAIHLIVYKDGQPSEIYFAGMSYD